jgi:hypothetical protein
MHGIGGSDFQLFFKITITLKIGTVRQSVVCVALFRCSSFTPVVIDLMENQISRFPIY